MVEDDGPDLIGVFPCPEAFVEDAFGYVAVRGGKVICGATAAACAARSVEIQITTAPEARREGIATAVSAALIADCLERGIAPHWSTVNDASRALAEKLGYVVDGSHETLARGPGLWARLRWRVGGLRR